MEQIDVGLVTEYAALAPSVHNTQPWELRAGGNAVDVRADRSRQLSFLDPDGRQLHISCGIAAEFARLAVRAQGHACTVTLLPDPADRDLLARLTVGDAEPATDEETTQAAAIPRRYTDRLPYDPQPVPRATVDRLRHVAEGAGAWLHAVERPEDRVTLAAILTDAEAAEAADPRYAEELARWTRPAPAAEGLTAEAAGQRWPADVVPDVPLRDFSGHAAHPRPGAGDPPRVERDTLLLVGTDRDDPEAWLATGRAVARVLLTATGQNLVAQPLGPATDFPASRARVRHELRLAGHPQFLFRLGYGSDRPWTRRRSAPEGDAAAD
jgi:nitroreductase